MKMGDMSGVYKKQIYSEMPKRKQHQVARCRVEDEYMSGLQKGQTFSFRVLLPNGTTLEMKIREPGRDMSVDQLVEAMQAEYLALKCRTESHRRQINWKSQNLYILDPFDRKIKGLDFRKLNPRKSYMLRFHVSSLPALSFMFTFFCSVVFVLLILIISFQYRMAQVKQKHLRFVAFLMVFFFFSLFSPINRYFSIM